jgi:hypothetical protein
MDDNFFNLKNPNKQNKNLLPFIKHPKTSSNNYNININMNLNMKMITANMKLTSNKFKIQNK